ncbi:hypothetical protein Pfo_020336, partial [Paulownia fortunei]
SKYTKVDSRSRISRGLDLRAPLCNLPHMKGWEGNFIESINHHWWENAYAQALKVLTENRALSSTPVELTSLVLSPPARPPSAQPTQLVQPDPYSHPPLIS